MPETHPAARTGWTIETLYVHLDQRLEEAEKRYQQRYDLAVKNADTTAGALREALAAAMGSAKEAVAKAESANERRFESINEFRAALTDQTASQMTRVEADARLSSLTLQLSVIVSRLDRIEAKGAGMSSLWALIVGGAIFLAAIADVLVRVAGK